LRDFWIIRSCQESEQREKYVAQTLLSVPAFCTIPIGHRQECLCHTNQMEFKPMLRRVSVSAAALLNAVG